MRRILLILGFLFALPIMASANDVYISQSGSGSGTSCGSSQSAAYFNNGANWNFAPTGVQIGPGTTVHVCGTVTTTLFFQGSGAPGNTITLLAESGARLSQPAGQLLNLNGNSNVTLDGGTNGVIENTANGTGLAHSTAYRAVEMDGSGNVEIKNWTFSNLYVHTPGPNELPDETFSNCVYADPPGSGTISIHDNVMHDAGWCILLQQPSTSSLVDIYRNYIYNINHGVSASGPNQFTLKIHDNHFGATANWDSTANAYHHDQIHLYGSFHPSTQQFVYNNLCDGNQGVNNTAHIFYEDSPPNVHDFGNIHLQYPGNYLNDGFVTGGGPNFSMMNDTFLGAGVNNQSLIRILGPGPVTFADNVMTGGNNLVSVAAGTTLALFDYNYYANGGSIFGGNYTWNWEAVGGTYSFGTWKSNCGGCDAHSIDNTAGSAGLSSGGFPLTGSGVLGAGTNLTSLGLTDLNAGTSAGNTVTPTPRPSSGPWTIGAAQGTSAPAPIVSLSPNPLAFGNVNSGANASLTETLNNIGSATLTGTIAVVGGAPYSITGGTCSTSSLSVAASGSCTVIVRFAPTGAGSFPDTLRFTTNAGTSPDNVSLTGTGVATAPVVSLSCSPTLSFGSVHIGGGTQNETCTVSNTGSATLTGTIALDTATRYVITGGTCSAGSLSVAASGSCTVILTYTPTAVHSVSVDSVGPSSAGQGCLVAAPWSGPQTCTWSHTVASGANPLIVGVATNIHNDVGISTSATYNGIPMIPVPGSLVHANSFTVGYIQSFELVNPPAGAHNVVVSVAGSSTTQRLSIIGGSLSFTGSFGPTVLSSATGLSQTISLLATGGTSNGLFAALAAGGSPISAPTLTSRWLNNFNLDAGAGNAGMQTALAGVSANFQYSIASMPDYWAITALLIAPGDGDVLRFTTNAGSSPDLVTCTGTGIPATGVLPPTNLQIFPLQ